MRTDLPHVLCDHALAREQAGIDLASRRLWDSRCFSLSATDEQKQKPAGGFDGYGALACIVISVFLIVWITLVSKSLSFGSVVFLFALPWALLRAGAIVTAALRFPSFFALDFLLGVTVVSFAVLTWKFLVPRSLWVLLFVLLMAMPG